MAVKAKAKAIVKKVDARTAMVAALRTAIKAVCSGKPKALVISHGGGKTSNLDRVEFTFLYKPWELTFDVIVNMFLHGLKKRLTDGTNSSVISRLDGAEQPHTNANRLAMLKTLADEKWGAYVTGIVREKIRGGSEQKIAPDVREAIAIAQSVGVEIDPKTVTTTYALEEWFDSLKAADQKTIGKFDRLLKDAQAEVATQLRAAESKAKRLAARK